MKTTLLTLMMTGLLIGCGSAEESKTASVYDNLDGTYELGCEKSGGYYFTYTRVLSGTNIKSTNNTYSDASCKTQVMTSEASGTITLKEEAGEVSGSRALDISESLVVVKVSDPAIVNTYNTAKFLGYTNWAVNVAKNVKIAPNYTIILADEKGMALGNATTEYDTSTEAKRPKTVGRVYIKK